MSVNSIRTWKFHKDLDPFQILDSPALSTVLDNCVVASTPWTVARQTLRPWNSPGKNTGVGCHSLRQGIFLIQGLNPGFLHCRQILYCLIH